MVICEIFAHCAVEEVQVLDSIFLTNLQKELGQEPNDKSKQPIRTRYLGHVTGYQPIREQYFHILSVPKLGYNIPQKIWHSNSR